MGVKTLKDITTLKSKHDELPLSKDKLVAEYSKQKKKLTEWNTIGRNVDNLLKNTIEKTRGLKNIDSER